MGCNASTTGVAESENAGSVSVYPNPMNASATISSDMKNCSVKIIDVTGNQVRTISNVEQFPLTIERGSLASGVYMLELTPSAAETGNNIERRKLVIE